MLYNEESRKRGRERIKIVCRRRVSDAHRERKWLRARENRLYEGNEKRRKEQERARENRLIYGNEQAGLPRHWSFRLPPAQHQLSRVWRFLTSLPFCHFFCYFLFVLRRFVLLYSAYFSLLPSAEVWDCNIWLCAGSEINHFLSRQTGTSALLFIVSFAAIIRVVTQRSSQLTAAHERDTFLSLCFWEPIECTLLLSATPIWRRVNNRIKSSFNEIYLSLRTRVAQTYAGYSYLS